MNIPQHTIMEQFKVIEDAVRDLKEMMNEPASKYNLPPFNRDFNVDRLMERGVNIPYGFDPEGNISNRDEDNFSSPNL